jgi:2-C-methyl-D-erythritol 2,4-cyclodiphosphate synthase
MRVGIGFDIHRLRAGRPLLLGGVRIPHPAGLVGHSDGDVLFHAMIDAILGGAGLGNIGERFPDTDPRFDGADSGLLLAEAARLARNHGFSIANIDSNILAERPRLQPYFREMEARATSILDLAPGQVGIKAKTFEGLGPIGRGEAIAAEAVALLTAG